MSGRKFVMPQYGDCSAESSVVTLVFETKFDIRMQHLYRTQYGEDPLLIMLFDVGYNNFKRLVLFCTRKRWKDCALHRNILIESW
jgi:hypothetical protein